ncbi:SnoaL-like polyketide cyclase [Rathayibacter oskolensis]|uniref:SnoaL-like polyketide cyclase n=1 Tax=Rathayibacter oskolensis TaxID=1891671 RepID=A0A1X7P1A7_9MICO|nr:ester cyclase [Rathayibacter oskolensis]SMH44055.1 SnoaL-like polyketide cyclase [Rathayibacter oskolensis]
MTTTTITDAAGALFRVLESGSAELAREVIADDFSNPTASNSPLVCRTAGHRGVLASSAWLRSAFPDLSFSVQSSSASNDQVWLRLRMRGTHTGPFVRYDSGGLAQVIPPTGRPIDVEQIHLVSLSGGMIVHHDALRDDLGMLEQLGVFPPGPRALRMAWWKLTGRAARAGRDVSAAAEAAASSAGNGPVAASAIVTPTGPAAADG